MTGREGWLGPRLDRLVALQTEISVHLSARWHRFIDRASHRSERLAGSFLVPWYRFTERAAVRSKRLAGPVRVIWHRMANGWERVIDPVRVFRHWSADRIAAGWERVAGSFLVPWYRFTDRVAVGWERLADGFAFLWYRSVDRVAGVAPGRKALAAGLSLSISLAVIALIRSDTNAPARDDVSSVTAPPAQVTDTGEEPRRGTTTSNDRLPGVKVHVNDQAGYLFSYPDRWDLSTSGTNTALLSPDGEVMISFGIAPPGTLHEASDRLIENLSDIYTDVRLVSGDVERTAQGRQSLVIGGKATDAAGANVRFLIITIRGMGQNRVISVHFAAGSDPLDALPAIREIIASFRISRPA